MGCSSKFAYVSADLSYTYTFILHTIRYEGILNLYGGERERESVCRCTSTPPSHVVEAYANNTLYASMFFFFFFFFFVQVYYQVM